MNTPNVVMIFADQLRRDALGCYGNTICQTPNLDALAARGMRFDQAYTTSPQCSPARTSLMTGRYPHTHTVCVNTHLATAWNRGLDPRAETFVGPLKAAGYALDYVGKWHVNEDHGPTDFGFDRHHRAPWPESELVEGTLLEAVMPNARQPICGVVRDRAESHLQRECDQAMTWLRERYASGQPCFLRVDHIEPHFPCMAEERFAALYDAAAIPPWPNFADDLADKPQSHRVKRSQWGLDGAPWSFFAESLARYYAVVTALDEQVGRMMACFDELGLWDDTILLVTCDHGDAQSSHGHFEKSGTMYDEIFRLPLIVAGAGIVQGSCDAFVRLQDLMPTFCDWAGRPCEERVEARSIAGLCRGEPAPADWTDAIYAEHHGGQSGYCSQRMLRTRAWKYCHEPFGGDELYDLQADPWELHNLIDDPEHAVIKRELQARMLGWNDATGDHIQWKWARAQFPDPIPPAGP